MGLVLAIQADNLTVIFLDKEENIYYVKRDFYAKLCADKSF